MKQYTYSMTDKRTGKSQSARATAANPTIARGQIILAYGDQYEVCELYCDINPAHHFVGEIDCSDFPLSDLDWLMHETDKILTATA